MYIIIIIIITPDPRKYLQLCNVARKNWAG